MVYRMEDRGIRTRINTRIATIVPGYVDMVLTMVVRRPLKSPLRTSRVIEDKIASILGTRMNFNSKFGFYYRFRR